MAAEPGGTQPNRSLDLWGWGGTREGFDCVDVTGSHHRAKDTKSLPAKHMGITNINYGGSNSSYNTIYIPCPSQQRLDPEAPPFPYSFFTSLILWTALFPAASCLQESSKQRERAQTGRPERQRGRECRKTACIP